MNKKEIIKLILSHEDLYQTINNFFMDNYIDCHDIMDPIFSLIDSEDELGVNFTGDKKVIQFFFLGTSSHFPCIWIGNDDEEKIDEMPVYHLDFEEENSFESFGNFRNFMEEVIDTFIESCKDNKNIFPEDSDKEEYIKEALEVRELLKKLSTNVIDKGDYIMIINDLQ